MREKCRLMWKSQRMVFKGMFVIPFSHSISEPPSLFWVLPHLMSLVVGTTYLFLEMLKMPVICFSYPTSALALLQQGCRHII